MKFQSKNRCADISTKKRDVYKVKHTQMRHSEFKNYSIDLSKHNDGVHTTIKIYKTSKQCYNYCLYNQTANENTTKK